MNVRLSSAPLGAEVTGLDLTQPFDEETFRRIEDLFHERGVIVFRGQHLNEEHHLAFSRRFGDLQIHPATQYLKPGYPELLVVSNIIEDGHPIGMQDAGQYWHTDMSYVGSSSRCSLLYAIEVPIENGIALGDTLFASSVHAYDTLSDSMKRRLEGLRAVHGYAARYKMQQTRGTRAALSADDLKKVPEVSHPVVRAHPWTGRKTLYVNEGFTMSIEGLAEEESASLLRSLYDHITRPEAIYRHSWQPGDLLMWDNGATQHCAVANYALPLRRRMHRATVAGK